MKLNRTVKTILALLLSLIFTLYCIGCSSNAKSSATAASYDYEYVAEESAPLAAPMAMDSGYGMGNAALDSSFENADMPEEQADAGVRKIIYTANLSVTADAPESALMSITEKAKMLGGYVASSYTTTDELGAYRCSATIKVPADKLEELVTLAKTSGKVNSYNLHSDDVSMEYYDIAARLESAKNEEAQLTEILKGCTTVEEVLMVRTSLAEVRSEIEAYQGRINLWDSLVSYATLELTVYRTELRAVEKEKEPIEIWKASDVFKKMSLGFTNSARFVVNAFGAIGIFLATAAVPAGVVIGIFFAIRAILNKTKGSREERKARRLAKIEAKKQELEKKRLEKKQE